MSDTVKSVLLLAILLVAIISAPISGFLADRFGPKRVTLWVLAGWLVLMPAGALAPDFKIFAIISVIAGIWFGAVWTVTRTLVMKLTPPERINQSFSYYTLLERLATFVGPVSWGLIIALAPKSASFNYKEALMAMTVFVAIGLFIALKIPEDKKLSNY